MVVEEVVGAHTEEMVDTEAVKETAKETVVVAVEADAVDEAVRLLVALVLGSQASSLTSIPLYKDKSLMLVIRDLMRLRNL